MVNGISFAAPPEPTEWCNVHFVVSVPGHASPVAVWLGWDGDLGLEAPDIGNAAATAAFRFVDTYRRTQVVEVHRLLGKARDMYRQMGENSDVGHVPSARIAEAPVRQGTSICLVVEMEGHLVTGKLSESLDWVCSTTDVRMWSTARHAALDYVLSNLELLEAQGFDTALLRQQLGG